MSTLRESQFVAQDTEAYRRFAEMHVDSPDDVIRCFAASLLTMCELYEYARAVDLMLDAAEEIKG